MDRNPNDGFDRTDTGTGSSLGTGPTSNRPSTDVLHENAAGSGAYAGAAGTVGQETTERSEQDRRYQGRDMAREQLGRVREKASQLKTTLADRLESGADRLRQRTHGSGTYGSSTLADTGASADTTRQRDAKQRVGEAVASGMTNTAQWLRTADVNAMKSGLENQVRTNPARSLIVALGLGYVLGKIFRGAGGGGGRGGRS